MRGFKRTLEIMYVRTLNSYVGDRHYGSIFVAPKCFTWKTFYLIRSITYENLRLTVNNHEIPQKTAILQFVPCRTLKVVGDQQKALNVATENPMV